MYYGSDDEVNLLGSTTSDEQSVGASRTNLQLHGSSNTSYTSDTDEPTETSFSTGNSLAVGRPGQRTYIRSLPPSYAIDDIARPASEMPSQASSSDISRPNIYEEFPGIRQINPEYNPEAAMLFPVDSDYDSAEQRVRRLYQRDDLAENENLNEVNMLDHLRSRYENSKIYTYVGETVLVLNPYMPVPLYGKRDHIVHHGQQNRHDREPHIYYIADKAYQRMLQNRTDQCILVSGESGAGKTETTKHLISHLTFIASQKGNDLSELTNRISGVNPVLEAFGNAETVMNQNSSRFGKLVEMTFTSSGDLAGANIVDYLLEKTRVIQQSEGERNFHIFYYIFAGLNEDRLKYYYLENPYDHSIMAVGSDNNLFPGQDGKARCAHMFREVETALKQIGFSENEFDQMYRCLAAILFITNISFIPDTDSDDPYTERIVPQEDYPLDVITELLNIDKQRLLEALISSSNITNGEEVVKMHSEMKAVDTRDSLAKALYSRLFGWIIKQINTSLKLDALSNLARSMNIGILDFSGFENFRSNSFEQLCINMANEQLQYFFLKHMCVEEQEQYLKENIPWTPIEIPYNEDRIRMFLDKPTGLLELLNDGCRQPTYTDEDFVTSLANHFKEGTSSSKYFDIDKTNNTNFIIKHYAAKVQYDATGFLEKNRDCLSPNLRDVMISSQNEFIKDLFTAQLSDTGCLSRTRSSIRRGTANRSSGNIHRGRGNDAAKNTLRTLSRRRQRQAISSGTNTSRRSQPTIATFFRASLHDMLTKLKQADPSFVRCIKPNNQQKAGEFHENTVLHQLRYTGVLEIAEIRRLGFPVRMLFRDFVERYRLLTHPMVLVGNAQSCQTILRTIATPADYRIGKSKVFMKDYVMDRLNERVQNRAATVIQRLVKAFLKKARLNRNNMRRRPRVSIPVTRVGLDDEMRKPPSSRPLSAGIRQNPFEFKTNSQLSKATVREISIQVDEDDINLYEEIPESPKIQNKDEDSSDDEGIDLTKKAWDIATEVDLEPLSPEESFRGVMKFLRVFMYIFIFIMVLGSATISQLCLLMLTAGVGVNSNATDVILPSMVNYNELQKHIVKDSRWKRAVLQLLAVICTPRIITFVVSFFKCLFGTIPWPSAGIFCLVMVMETLQTIGETLLVLRVLPRFGSIMSLCMLFSVALLPSILKLIFWVSHEQKKAIDKKHRNKRRAKQHLPPSKCLDSLVVRAIDKVLTFLAFLVQGAGIGFPILVLINQWNPFWLRGKQDTSYYFKWDLWMYWEIPLALVLTSLKWWENFVHRDRGPFKLARLKQQLFACRPKMSCVTGLWTTFVCVATFYLMELARGNRAMYHGGVENVLWGNNSFDNVQPRGASDNNTMSNSTAIAYNHHLVLSMIPCVLQVIFAFLCYYFCSLACKLMMQKISFVGPLYLSVGATATVIILQCHGVLPAFPDQTKNYVGYTWLCDYYCPKPTKSTNPNVLLDLPHWVFIVIATAWVISLLYIAVYVWNYNNEKMAMRERLFVMPFYVGPVVVPSMLLNRRSLDQEVKLSLNGTSLEYRKFDEYTTHDHFEQHLMERGKKKKDDEDEKPVPMIYACATMWHETEQEMKQLLKSIFRMDMDQCARKLALKTFGVGKSDYYEFETQIYFDDAMVEHEKNKGVYIPNTWVKKMLSVINEAASAIYETEVELPPPTKIPTPYGGQLVWILPGGNKLITHVKNKNKIRHKKRWSQVMYMYYLLGWKLLGNDTKKMVDESIKENKLKRRRQREQKKQSGEENGHELGKLVNKINDKKGKLIAEGHFSTGLTFQEIEKKVLRKAENTFILALDGDVDFKPEAVLMLVDRLKRNMKTGAACGRIHPIGSGPMVWYQIFEYAIGHWMQKASEHVFGCVLCSPGCFTLFRGSTLMDTNVMKRYTTKSTEATHFLQYDQGEDRWLCTLILQQGYRVDYCAGADALTFAPEGFIEFFNQRRRWVTSTLANQLDLMASYKNTVLINDNISQLFMMYQLLLTASTILGPSTIIIAIASAFKEILHTHQAWSYILAIVPIVIYIVICHVCKEKHQLIVAGLLSAVYACVMVVVLVGILKSLTQDSILAPSLMFVIVLSGCFILGGILHPYEFFCLAPGILYYLCIPAGYLILIIYSFSNMQVVSWGTRETPKPANAPPPKKEEKKKKSKFWSFLNLDRYYKDFKLTLVQMFTNKENQLQQQQLELMKMTNDNIKIMAKNLKKMVKYQKGGDLSDDDEDVQKPAEPIVKVKYATKSRSKPVPVVEEPEVYVENPDRPVWATELEELKEGPIEKLKADELEFWEVFINKYEKPLKDSPKAKAELQSKLIELRNNTSFAVWFINGLWIIFNYMMETALKPISIGSFKTPPLGFVFLILFFLLLILQLIGMCLHRWGTFLQLIANTELPNPWRKSHKRFESQTVEEAIRVTKEMQRRRTFLDFPEADYDGAAQQSFRQFLSNTLRGRRPRVGWSDKLRRSTEEHRHNAEESIIQPHMSHIGTISKGVALSIRQGRGSERTYRPPDDLHGGPIAHSPSKRYLRPNELERRFEKRYNTLSRRYKDFSRTFDTIEI